MKNRRRIVLHGVVWLIMLLVIMFAGINNGSSIHHEVVVILYFGLINISIFYINYLVILPKFLLRQRYTGLFFSIIILILGFGLIKYGVAYYFKDIALHMGPRRQPGETPFADYYLRAMFVSTFFVLISTAYKFTVDWFTNQKLRKNLEKDKLTAELAFLKSQINPHFLLNSLNNIYSLAYQRSPKTPEAILKLAEIMRYMLYESNDLLKVDLAKEIGYLESYIDLQRLRFKNEASIKLEILEDGSYYSGDDSYYTIVPLILISFVENAFKHGVVTDAEHPIDIQIHIKQGKLHFKVSNLKSAHNKDEMGGIGLNNVKRRLDLLYPGKYKLDINENDSSYASELSLDL